MCFSMCSLHCGSGFTDSELPNIITEKKQSYQNLIPVSDDWSRPAIATFLICEELENIYPCINDSTTAPKTL